ncbi:MAG: ABC transporter permease [Acidimicrobiia bacterium]|nr:ABC transporter permease [Acidimicrobiia bacterium]
MPEQSPDAGQDLVGALAADEATHDVPPDASTIMIAAVEAVDDAGTAKKKTIGVAGWLCVVWLVLLVAIAITGAVTDQKIPGLPKPNQDVGDFKLAPFSSGHLLGTDSSGRDTLSLVANGAYASMTIGVFSVLIGFFVGGLFGILAGYYKGKVGAVLGSTTDIFLAFPPLVLAISIVTFMGNSLWWVTLALAIVSIPVIARIARASTLSWAEREFVTAARAQGAKHRRVMVRELVPNVLPAMLSIALLGMAVVIVAEASLAIVGAGVSSDTITWGSIINGGRQDLTDAPYIVLIPSFVIFITVMALNYLGDALRAKFDVRESAL